MPRRRTSPTLPRREVLRYHEKFNSWQPATQRNCIYVYVWDIVAGSLIKHVEGHGSSISCMAFESHRREGARNRDQTLKYLNERTPRT
ncbi:hypothetical protein BV22DRAFT_270961 [Leucogyrophana mollusca]|uniref:Uncharacterized protein n=1 Tax=Leucogyrophana mollusca TaxID=85980 RepID=A0ACB8BPX4_9AGAM|nr:hypothetical protein BV22DRAFT_270961 [Leucogyrophana mollusca]